jgi:hypothetical protein
MACTTLQAVTNKIATAYKTGLAMTIHTLANTIRVFLLLLFR